MIFYAHTLHLSETSSLNYSNTDSNGRTVASVSELRSVQSISSPPPLPAMPQDTLAPCQLSRINKAQ